MELYEYVMYNYGFQNEHCSHILSRLYDSLMEKGEEASAMEVYRALQVSKGYTEYKVKEIADELGFTKTKVKYLVKQLSEDNQIELMVENNMTFLKPIFH